MDPECRIISKLILPAVRASVAETMKRDYNFSQKRIADALGVVQVSISKHLNNRHSSDIESIKQYIGEHGLGRQVIESIIANETPDSIGRKIDELCESLVHSPAMHFSD